MYFPPFKINIVANQCSCCNSNTVVEDYRVIYDRSQNKWFAISTAVFDPSRANLEDTNQALDQAIQRSYFVAIDQLGVRRDPGSFPSMEEVVQIEREAYQIYLERSRSHSD